MNVKFYLSWDCNNFYEEVKNDLENDYYDEDDAEMYKEWCDYVDKKLNTETTITTLEELGDLLVDLFKHNCFYRVDYICNTWQIMIDCY